MRPDASFKNLVQIWFEYTAKFLRISHFLLGKARTEEESDFEDEDESLSDILYSHRPQNLNFDELNEESDDGSTLNRSHSTKDDDKNLNENTSRDGLFEKEVPRSRSTSKRELRFMRVPKIDNIEIVPGEKLLIPMREDEAVFGRPNESQEEINTNWTKVYVPDHFFHRVNCIQFNLTF